jgi:hypothetical protein
MFGTGEQGGEELSRELASSTLYSSFCWYELAVLLLLKYRSGSSHDDSRGILVLAKEELLYAAEVET